MIIESQIREQLGRYLEGKSSFEQFEDWLVGNSYNMHKDSNQQAQNLVHDIDLVIYEYLDGNIMEDKLKSMLRSLLIQPRLVRVVVGRQPLREVDSVNASTLSVNHLKPAREAGGANASVANVKRLKPAYV